MVDLGVKFINFELIVAVKIGSIAFNSPRKAFDLTGKLRCSRLGCFHLLPILLKFGGSVFRYTINGVVGRIL
ncbi:MAG: hypothetical protein QOK24_2796 [Verrucomicrobiota bacterium]